MASELQQLEATIQGLESQRALLGGVVDAALGPLRDRLATLRAAGADAHPAPALRQLSILFMDTVGSTALAEHLDAEEVAAVMNGVLARATAIVERLGERSHHRAVCQYAARFNFA